MDASSLTQLYNDGMDEEVSYELDSEVHLQDPCWVQTSNGWDAADTEEIATEVGPWFGNRFSREHTQPPEGCREGYEGYTLRELNGKVQTGSRRDRVLTTTVTTGVPRTGRAGRYHSPFQLLGRPKTYGRKETPERDSTREESLMAGDVGAARPGETESRWAWLDGWMGAVGVGSLVVAVGAALVQVSFGTYTMPITEAWLSVFDPRVWTNPQFLLRLLLGEGPGTAVADALGFSTAEVDLSKETLIVWQIRMPRVLVALFAGINLAISGAIFQAVTRNELASPFVLGVSAGAGLAVLLTLVVFTGLSALLPVAAALGGALAFLLVYAIAWKNGTTPVRLVLAGIVVSTVFQSLQTGLYLVASDLAVVQSAIAWTTGSLTGVDWEQVRTILPWTLLSLGLSLVGARQLNVLLLGENTAQSLGMSVERVRFALSAVAIVAASSAIAVAGIVSFVGLIVPHIARSLVGSDYKRLLLACTFVGPALMVVADVGARLGFTLTTGGSTQLPVGIITGLIGGPYFLYLMRRQDGMGDL
jgi:iron complex transport system permease protein